MKHTNIFRNRKGTFTEEMTLWIPRLAFTIIAGVILHLLVSTFLQTEISVLDADAEIFNNRLLTSRDGISYQDQLNGRIYPGIIDQSKFNDIASIEKSIFYGEESTYLGAKLKLYDANKKLISEQTYHNLAYRREAESYLPGKGGVEVKEKDIYVLIKDKDRIQPGFLHTIVVISRS